MIWRYARKGYAIGFWLYIGVQVLLLVTGRITIESAIVGAVLAVFVVGPVLAIVGAIIGAIARLFQPRNSPPPTLP